MDPSGLVVVDKPGGMTSHDVVARVRRIAGTRRVGHGGTLDPMATGVLIIGVGRATRLLTYVIGTDKAYRATIRLGASTITDDVEGEIVASTPAGHVTDEQIRTGVARLTGTITQVPSAVSAIKIDGKRSYARVRAGEQVVLDGREVTVYRLAVNAIRREVPEHATGTPPEDATGIRLGEAAAILPAEATDGAGTGVPAGMIDVDVEVECSSGTYVRALARDLGAGLGVGGHLTALRRTVVGGFTQAEAVPLDVLAEEGTGRMMPLAQAAARLLPRRDVPEDEARVLGHGGPLTAQGVAGPYAVFGPSGEVIAVVSERDGRARPEVVLSPAG